MSPAAVDLLASDLLQAAIIQVFYSSIFAAMVMISLRLLRVRAPLIREAAWSLVLLRLMVPPCWHSRFSLRGLLDSWLATEPATGGVQSFAQSVVVSGQPQLTTSPSAIGWQSLVVLGWICIGVAIATLLVLRMNHYRRICHQAAIVDDPAMNGMVADWKARLEVRRTIRLVSSDASLSPFTAGSWRPSIHLPQAALAWDHRALDAIIGHEMVHISRWDEVRILIINLIRTVHFFNPVAWLAAVELSQAREERCDEVVVRTGAVAASDYRRSLVDILRLNQIGQPTVDAVVGLIDRKEGIKMRVVSIQSESLPRSVRPVTVIFGTILAAALLVPMAPAEGPSTASQSLSQDSDSDVTQQQPRINVLFAAQPDVMVPRFIEGPDPEYTDLAVAEGTAGTVKLDVTVDTDGAVLDVQVVQGLPHGLTETAVEAVRTWRFRPARRDGVPVELTMLVGIVFSLFDATPQDLDADLVATIEPLLPAGVTLTSLTTEGELIHLEGLASNPDQITGILGNLADSPAFSQTVLESVSREENGVQFRMTFEKAR